MKTTTLPALTNNELWCLRETLALVIQTNADSGYASVENEDGQSTSAEQLLAKFQPFFKSVPV